MKQLTLSPLLHLHSRRCQLSLPLHSLEVQHCIYLHSSPLIKSFPRSGTASTEEKMTLFFNRLSSSLIKMHLAGSDSSNFWLCSHKKKTIKSQSTFSVQPTSISGITLQNVWHSRETQKLSGLNAIVGIPDNTNWNRLECSQKVMISEPGSIEGGSGPIEDCACWSDHYQIKPWPSQVRPQPALILL